MEFGEKLKAQREEKGMTQQTLADQLYVTRQAVSKWESGSRYPDLMTTKCIANILGTTIDSLVSDDEMKEFSEKQAIAEGQRAGKIISSMYLIAFIISIMTVLPYILPYIANFGFINGETAFDSDSLISTAMVIRTLGYIPTIIIAGYGFIASVKKDVNAKVAGLIGVILFLEHGFFKLSYIFSLKNLTFYQVLPLWIYMAILLLMALVVALYFFKQKVRLVKLLYIGCVLVGLYSVLTSGYQMMSYALNNQWEIYQWTMYSNMLGTITELVFMSLLIIQAMILERKRKLCGIK